MCLEMREVGRNNNVSRISHSMDPNKIFQLGDLAEIGFLGLLCEERYGFLKRLEYLFAKLLRNIEFKLGVPLPRIVHALPAERILGIVWKNEFEKKAGGRKIGEENKDSHYRKGVHGDWKNYLTRDHIALIKQQYDDVILQYAYEKSPDWQL